MQGPLNVWALSKQAWQEEVKADTSIRGSYYFFKKPFIQALACGGVGLRKLWNHKIEQQNTTDPLFLINKQ